MTKATDARVDIDPDMLAVARAIWGNRHDQKFGGNQRWRQLQAQLPGLAEAVRPSPASAPRARTELDCWRDEQEEEHRLFERWAQSQTAARSLYYYSGGHASAMRDAESSSPKWMKPYQCWRHADRGRWSRSKGAGPDETTWSDSRVGHSVRGRDLRGLHAETDGGYGIEGDGVFDNQLEVCRLCGKPLDFERDGDGRVIRGRGEQPEYCSRRCKLDVFNARRREQRRSRKTTSSHPKPFFDLHGVYIAGMGKLAVTPEQWNRMQPRCNPSTYLHAFDSPPKPRPWFNPPKARSSKYEYRLPVHRVVAHLRHRPCLEADPWIRVGPRTSTQPSADRIARRWREYGAGRGATTPVLARGWDRVHTHWRYPAGRSRPVTVELKEVGNGVWRISH